MYNIHMEGGIEHMVPLSLLLIINLAIIAFVLISVVKKKQINRVWLESIKQIGGLAFVMGTFSTLIAFYAAFEDLSKMTETLPFYVIMGGLKVALITVVYGSIIFIVSLVAYVALKLINRNYAG